MAEKELEISSYLQPRDSLTQRQLALLTQPHSVPYRKEIDLFLLYMSIKAVKSVSAIRYHASIT